MNKGLLRFFTHFTSIERIKHCIKDRTCGVLLGTRKHSTNDFIVVGRLYVSEHNAYMVLSSWHTWGFKKYIEPYVYCTKLFAYPRADMHDELNIVYHITGIKDSSYVSELS